MFRFNRSVRECWRVAPTRNLKSQRLLFALRREVLLEPLSQITSIASNDIVLVRVITLCPAEDQNPNLLFCDLIRAIADVTIDYVQQKFCEQPRPPQAATCGDASHKLPPGITLMCMSVGRTHAR